MKLTDEDFLADEAARDRYEIYTEAEESALTLKPTPVFMNQEEYDTFYPGGLTQ